MCGLTFDELFSMLLAVQLSPDDLSRLREWIAGIADPAECIALIEQAAAGRPCPHCGCARKHRCGQASGLQRFRCLGCGHSHNALTGTPLARLRTKELCATPRKSSVCIVRPASDGATGSCPARCATGRRRCRPSSRPTKPTGWNRRRGHAT